MSALSTAEFQLGTHAFTNYYACPNEGWMWANDSSRPASDKCPRCGYDIEPVAARTNWGGQVTVYDPSE